MDKKREIPFFPHHWLLEVIAAFIFIGILLSLSILIPFELDEKANSLETPLAIKPEWYFLAMYQMLKYMPKVIGIIISGIAAAVFIVFPFFDYKNPHTMLSKRPLVKKLIIVSGILFVLFTFLGFISEKRIKFLGNTYDIDLLGAPHRITNENK